MCGKRGGSAVSVCVWREECVWEKRRKRCKCVCVGKEEEAL